MNPEQEEPYQPQGGLDVGEAKRILARLEEKKIRFQLETDVSGRKVFRQPLKDARVQLFIHAGDLEAWQRIRAEFFPIGKGRGRLAKRQGQRPQAAMAQLSCLGEENENCAR